MSEVRQFAAWFPGRKILVSGDSVYGGLSMLQHLPEKVDSISRVASNAALYEPASPPRPNPKIMGLEDPANRIPKAKRPGRCS
jgi:hypothetical protein